MNRLQANICLLCVTLCWSLEVILYACIPGGTPAFATSCVTCLAGEAFVVAAVALVYPEIDTVFLTKAVFGNTAGFPIVFGIPLAILMQEEFGFKAT